MKDTCKLCQLLAIVITVFSLLCPLRTYANWLLKDPFDVQYEFYEDISGYLKQFPYMEFVYGNPSEKASGILVTITPHPEYAWAITGSERVYAKDFRVWIDVGKSGTYDFVPFGLFYTDSQSLQYLDIRRKSTKTFALFISSKDIEERVPRGYTYDKLGVIDFKLRPRFARSIDAEYPDGDAIPFPHAVWPFTWITYKPFGNVLQCKVVGVEEAHRYMDEHPERKYFFKREEVWNCMGWFLNMSYIRKNIIRGTINENHYVIFTLWKDEEHTKPLLISYMKDNLFSGGATADASRMEERFNYIAYPHKGFDDWSLFINWECVDYWWKDHIKATKDNHICTAYFTLTLSNDGKTPANGKAYDYSGWLSIEKEVPEEKPDCPGGHEWELKFSKYGSGSFPLPGGCTRNYDIYLVYKHCLKCDKNLDCDYINLYTGDRCLNHNFKEISRKEIGRRSVIQDGQIITTITYEVLSQCQNDCCSCIEWKTINIPDPPKPSCPPHDWKILDTKEKGNPTVKEIDRKEERKENKLIITTTYLITTTYEVTERCEKCKCERKKMRVDKKEDKKIEIIELPQPEPEPCPPHHWKDVGRKEIKREKVITDEDCFTTVITYEVIGQCQKCKLEKPTREEPEEIPHCHEWTYYSTKEREIVKGTKHVEPYDKDSLTIDTDSLLCMAKDTLDNQEPHCYVLREPVCRHTWLAFNKDNNYMGFTDDDAGVLNAVTYQEAEDLIEKINEEVRKKQLNVTFNLPTVEEMRQLIKEDKVKFDADPVQPLTYFYVDSIEVYDGKGQRVPDDKLITAPEGAKLRIMVGRMNKDGEVEMVDIFTADAETGFMLVATPFTPEPKSTTGVTFYRKYWRRCDTCEIEQLITENQFRNGRYHRALIGD